MKPKEKAEELYHYFDYPNIPTGLMTSEIKQCALILVNELIRLLPSVNSRPPNYQEINEYCSEYWVEVKTELEK